jgi:basic membrane lipoprotein Med (substrate-binding protein (PBP1-ABC) superfamily)
MIYDLLKRKGFGNCPDKQERNSNVNKHGLASISRARWGSIGRRTIVPLLAIVVIGAVAAGCGSSSDGGSGGGGPKVAVLTVGTQDDSRWGQSLYEGADAAAKAGDADFQYTGNLNSPDQYVSQASSFASQGYPMVILANGGVAKAAAQLAKQFPDTTFCQGTYQPTPAERKAEPPNVCHFDVEQQEPSFLAGVAAGLATKTNTVGAIAAFQFPALVRQPEAFNLGARCVNPKVSFVQKYINSFTDVAFAKAATLSLMSQGADVIYSVTDDATEGVYAAARTKPGTWVIPQYYDSFTKAPDVVLTTVQFDLAKAETELLKQSAKEDGLEEHFFHSYNIKDGFGSLAPFHANADALSAADKEKLAEITSMVKDGTIKVPDETEGEIPLGTVGSGAKINPQSIGCPAA